MHQQEILFHHTYLLNQEIRFAVEEDIIQIKRNMHMHAVYVFFDMKYSNIKAWLKISRTNKY